MSDLSTFIQEHVRVVQPLEVAANTAYWNFTTTGKKEYEEELLRVQITLRKIYADKAAFARLKELTRPPNSDPIVARQATLLMHAFTGSQMDDATIEELTRRELAIESLFNSFRAELRGRHVTDNELREILRDSNDLGLRKEAWEASKQVGIRAAPMLVELIEMRNRVAREIGYTDFYRMHLELQELNEVELFGVFDELERLVTPAYRQYKSELDDALAKRFGMSADQLRPWHYADPFFQDAPAADTGIRDFLNRAFDGKDIEGMTRCFYKNLGLDVDDVLARSDLYEREGKQQHAYCINVDRVQDVRVLANIKPNHSWMGTMLHECGHAVYDKYLDPSLPYILRSPAHTLSTEAIAMLMGRLADEPEWLRAYVPGLDESELSHFVPQMQRRQSGQLLIMARWIPVMSHFERALYTDPRRQDLNALWWDLEERLQMVPRPAGRNAPDWAAKIHFSIAPVYYHNYLLGEMVASQLKHTIDSEVLAGDGKLLSSTEVGRYLVDRVFRPGARRHWQEALTYATGERLQPRYFVKQAAGVSA